MNNNENIKQADYGFLFKLTRAILRIFSESYNFDDRNLPSLTEPIVFVSHHQNMRGPIRLLLWLPIFCRIWAYASLTDQEECYQHYVDYTFTVRFKWPRWLAKVIALPLSYFVSSLSKSAQAIPVHRQSRRLTETIRESMQTLQHNTPLLIFPDIDYQSDEHQMEAMYEGFLSLEKFYYKRYQQSIHFVPIYANPVNKEITCGKPSRFKHQLPFVEERKKIAEDLHKELNKLIKIT